MGKKMLIDAAHPEETRVVVVQGNRIEEFDFESAAKKQLRGSIYLAKVTRVEPSLQAAFVDYGGNRHGFLAFSEIHPDYYQIPVADRQALLEEEAAEDRRFAEEQEEDERASSRRGGRRRNRRGRGRGRRGRSAVERQSDGLSVSVDALDPPASEPAFSDEAEDPRFSGEAPSAPTVERLPDDGFESVPELGGAPQAPETPDAITVGADPSDEARVDGPGPGDSSWLPHAAETDQTAVNVDMSDGDGPAASRPLLADPMPSIAVNLPEPQTDDRTTEEDTDQDEMGAADPQDAEPTGIDPALAGDEADDQENAGDFVADAPDQQEVEASAPEAGPAWTTPVDEDDAEGVQAEALVEGQDDQPGDEESDGDQTEMAADGETFEADPGLEETESDDVTLDAQPLDDAESLEDDDTDLDDDDDGDEDEVETVGEEDSFDDVRPRRSRLKNYKIQEVIKRRQIMLVQVVKEERGNKGAALTTYLSLAGRYCVLMPNTARGGGISRKITQINDRKRLKEVAASLEVPEGMGLIVRTAGAQRTKTEIKRDFEYLLRLWENVRDLTLRSSAPTLVYEEGNLVKRAIRDLYNKDIDAVLVEGDDGYKGAKAFMRMLMPSHARNVQPYRDRMPLFQRYQVEQQLDSMFSPQVELPSGGYLVINMTEALVAIDVNSGRATKEHSIEDTALKTNMEAAEEVARQLRLRDLAGLIVIDFIDMEDYRNNRTVEKRLKECLKNDRARIQVGKISAFGLLEMSRQRLRAGVLEGSTQSCPHCEGTGKMRSVESASLRVLRACEEEGIRERCATATVRVPHTVALYILNQKRRQLMDLELRYGLTVVVEADHTLYSSEFQLERGELLSEDRKAQIRDAAISMETAYEDDGEPLGITDEADEDEDEVETGEVEVAPDADAQDEESASGDRPRRRRRRRGRQNGAEDTAPAEEAAQSADAGSAEESEEGAGDGQAATDEDDADRPRRRRRRGKRGGRRSKRQPNQVEAGDENPEAAGVGAGDDDTGVPVNGSEGPFEPLPGDSAEPLSEASLFDGGQHNTHEVSDPRTDGPEINGYDPAPSMAEAITSRSGEAGDNAAGETASRERLKPPPTRAPREKKRGWWQKRFF